MRRKHAVLMILLLLTGLGLVGGLWLRSVVLNRQLIDALAKADFRQALALVNAGADPNTPKPTSASSPLAILQQFLHPVRPADTAFTMACGKPWLENDTAKPILAEVAKARHGLQIGELIGPHSRQRIYHIGSDQTSLVQAMLDHGANVNAQDNRG